MHALLRHGWSTSLLEPLGKLENRLIDPVQGVVRTYLSAEVNEMNP
jgi:hypothetical protein